MDVQDGMEGAMALFTFSVSDFDSDDCFGDCDDDEEEWGVGIECNNLVDFFYFLRIMQHSLDFSHCKEISEAFQSKTAPKIWN